MPNTEETYKRSKRSPFRFLFGRRKGTPSFVFFSPLVNFCFSLLCFNREQDQFARNPLPMISLELVIWIKAPFSVWRMKLRKWMAWWGFMVDMITVLG